MNKINNAKKERKSISAEIKRYLIASAVSLCLVVLMVLSMVLPNVLKKKGELAYKIPDIVLPIEDQYAIGTYGYSDLSNTAVTIRADIMNVIKRNVARQEPEILGNEFALIYNEDTKTLKTFYGTESNASEFAQLISSSNAATIKFTDYPSPSHEVSGAANAYESGTSGNLAISNSSDFYKYMLMTQGQHLAMEAQQRFKDGSLSSWLKKHPAADAQYGEVIGDAVVKEIILDPIYRANHATGLYLPAGEVVKVKVEGLAPGERFTVTVNIHNSLAWRGSATDDVYKQITGSTSAGAVNIQSVDAYFTKADVITANGKFAGNVTNQSQWARQNTRAPWIIADFVFTADGEYEIGTPFGGVMHINPGNCYSNVKTTFYGAVETPHYILGVTTPEYFETYLKDAPGVVGVIDTENGQLVSPTGKAGTSTYLRGVKTEEIDKLASLWHSFFAVNETFTGGTYNRGNIVKFDQHVPAGAAVALGGYVYACPTSWFGSATNYQGLLRSGSWGILHEVGHNHSSAYGSVWGFGDIREGEVRNNALTLLSYIKFCDVGTTIRNNGGAEHGEYANPYSTLNETLRFLNQIHTDIGDGTYGYFQFLGMYANIMHSFGADKFYELLYSYKADPVYSYVERTVANGIRADFNYRCATIYGMNFTNYFNTYYKANIKTDVYSAEQLAFMNGLPNYEPISCFYAGGIDGVKTAGDYKINFGEEIVFDLAGRTISSLDTADEKGFKIISISNATHGIITDIGDGRCIYTFNKNYTGATDEFKFKVKLSDGVIHEFTIYLRINYNVNSSKLTVYDEFDALNSEINEETWAAVLNKLNNLSYTTTNSDSYIHYFGDNDGKWRVETLEYYWKAPETGYITFHVQRDDGLIFYFGNDFDSLEIQGYYNGKSKVWSDSKGEGKKYYVEKGQYYAIKLVNLDLGNGTGNNRGFSFLAYKYEEKNITIIPTTEIYHPLYPIGQSVETYVFDASFMVSKKDSIKLSTTGTDKSEWTVVEAPENIQDGRYIVQEMIDPDEDSEFYGQVIGTFTTDKWNYLIDGENGTVFHTTWKGSDIKPPTETNPDIFIIDTHSIQQFNYFSVRTRSNPSSNALVTKYELWISDDNQEYALIVSGDTLEYKNLVATLRFASVSGRYLKFIVKGTTGKNFTIISELDAGIMSTTQRIIPATSAMLFTTKGWANTSEIPSERNGYMMAEKKNEKLVFRFNGENLAVYAAVGEGYGSAAIYLDGKYIQTSNFNSHVYEARKLVLDFENLEDKVHTLEIITKSSEKVMINLFGIEYTAKLVNAPNIYLERALTISLVVFILLFIVALTLLLCLLFIPKFRKLMGNNKAIAKLDEYLEAQKVKRKAKKEEKKKAKLAAKQDGGNAKTTKQTKVTDLKNTQKTEKPVDKQAEKTKGTVNEQNKLVKKPEKHVDLKAEQKSETKTNLKAKPEAKKSSEKVEAKKPAKAEQKPVAKAAAGEKSGAAKSTKTQATHTASKPAKPQTATQAKSAKPEAKKTAQSQKPAKK